MRLNTDVHRMRLGIWAHKMWLLYLICFLHFHAELHREPQEWRIGWDICNKCATVSRFGILLVSASEVTTLWRYTNLFIIIMIMIIIIAQQWW